MVWDKDEWDISLGTCVGGRHAAARDVIEEFIITIMSNSSRIMINKYNMR